MASPGTFRLRKTLKLPRFCAGIGTFQRNTYGTASISEYTAEPEYPPIRDTSREATRRRNKDVWHEKIKNLATVEQKFVELNMPKYYGYWSCHLKDTEAKINGLEFLKYATRTHIVESLPDNYYFDVKSEAEKLASDLQDKVEALIDLHFNG
ncbi:Structural constituent of ribosome, partial [Halocaridina rubra]